MDKVVIHGRMVTCTTVSGAKAKSMAMEKSARITIWPILVSLKWVCSMDKEHADWNIHGKESGSMENKTE
jgi:hypothetical protein